MSMADMRKILEDGIKGKLKDVESKVDGQNFTVTYDGKSLRYLGKGVSSKRMTEGGLLSQDAAAKFPENIREDFMQAMKDTESWIESADSTTVARAFAGGKIALECSLISKDNPITIRYGVDHVRTLRFCSPLGINIDTSATEEMLGSSFKGSRFDILPREKPRIKQIEGILLDFDTSAKSLGEIAREECERIATDQGIRRDFAKTISERIILGLHDHTAIKRTDRSGRLWETIKLLEADGNLRLRSLVPLEKLVQSLTNLVISCYEFDLTAQKDQHDLLIDHLKEIVSAYKSGDIAMIKDGKKQRLSDFWKERMKITIDRLGDSYDLLPVEGIVFNHDNRRLKMTGMYTSCHKLLAPFKFETKGEKLILLKS
jgi:hypothetical protein